MVFNVCKGGQKGEGPSVLNKNLSSLKMSENEGVDLVLVKNLAMKMPTNESAAELCAQGLMWKPSY